MYVFPADQWFSNGSDFASQGYLACMFVQGCAIYNTHDSHPNKELSCLKGQQCQVENPRSRL